MPPQQVVEPSLFYPAQRLLNVLALRPLPRSPLYQTTAARSLLASVPIRAPGLSSPAIRGHSVSCFMFIPLCWASEDSKLPRTVLCQCPSDRTGIQGLITSTSQGIQSESVLLSKIHEDLHSQPPISLCSLTSCQVPTQPTNTEGLPNARHCYGHLGRYLCEQAERRKPLLL